MKLSDKRPRPKLLEKNVARLFFRSNAELLPEEYQEQVKLPIEEFEIPHGKLTLSALNIPHPEARGTVLFYHGSTGTLKSWLLLFHYLHKKGYSVLGFEYPGYGKSSGKTTFSSFLYDSMVGTHYCLEKLPVKPEHLILYGHSMGCFAVQQAVIENLVNPSAIVLQSPIYSLDNLLQSRVPAFMRSWLGLKQFTLGPLYESEHHLNVLIGEYDGLISPEEREKWKARSNTRYIEFPQYKHASFINPKPDLLDQVFGK